MRRVGRLAAAVLAVLSLSLTGCIGPAPSTPSPSPSPTFMCTPEAGGSEAPCSEQQYQEMKAKDALYAEAEQVYRTYTTELIEAMRNGGADTLPPQLAKLISNSDLSASVLQRLRDVKEGELTLKGDATVAWAKRLPSRIRNGSVVAMEFCVDARPVTVYQQAKRVSRGSVSQETVYFAGESETMTIDSLDYKDVQKC